LENKNKRLVSRFFYLFSFDNPHFGFGAEFRLEAFLAWVNRGGAEFNLDVDFKKQKDIF